MGNTAGSLQDTTFPWKDGKGTPRDVSQKPHAPLDDMSERATWWPNVPGTLHHCYPHVKAPLHIDDLNLPKQNNTGRVELVKQDTVEHLRRVPSLAFRSIFLFHPASRGRALAQHRRHLGELVGPLAARLLLLGLPVKFASGAWLDGSKYFEMRRWELLPANFRRGCVVTMGDLGNTEVDEIFHIVGLKDLCFSQSSGRNTPRLT